LQKCCITLLVYVVVSNFWRGGTTCTLLSLEQVGMWRKKIVPLVQWGSGHENDSYVFPRLQLSQVIPLTMCVVVSPQKPLNLMIYQAKVSLLMPCMDLGFRVQGLELGALDLRHKKSNQFQALYIYIYIWNVWESFGEQTRDVSHCALAIYIKKYLNADKRRIMETRIFHPAKI
jgi:hypothetical protein